MATLYSEIRDDMLGKIEDGTYRDGEILPTELELAKQYGVSRPTIRQATQQLVEEGYLEKRRRRGTMVKASRIKHTFTSQIASFDDEMLANDRMPRTNVIMLKRMVPPAEVAGGLGLEEAEEAFKLVRLRFADEVPHEFSETYIPCSAYPNLDQEDFTKRRLYDVMRDYGDPVVSAHRTLRVVTSDPVSSKLLELSEGSPLVVLQSVGHNEQGEPREYTTATYQGEGNIFEFDVKLKGR